MKNDRPDIRNDILFCLALIPLYFFGIGRYGLKIAVLAAGSAAVGWSIEFIASKTAKTRGYSFPVWLILPLILPPGMPFWMGLLATGFAVLIPVIFFGGYGHHLVSPAPVGWTFGILSFSAAFGFGWSYPFTTALGGFTAWAAKVPVIDDPVTLFPDRVELFFDTVISGEFPQPPGNTLPLLTIGIGIILLLSRVTSVRTAAAFFGIYGAAALISRWAAPEVFPPLVTHLIGNTLMVGFFLLPDHRTASRTFPGRWLAGALAGISAFLIRSFSSFPGGTVFAVIIANIFCAIIDEGVVKIFYRRIGSVKRR